MSQEKPRTTKGNNGRKQSTDNRYAHLQPQVPDMERAVLGGLLIDKNAYTLVCELLQRVSMNPVTKRYMPLFVICCCMISLLIFGR